MISLVQSNQSRILFMLSFLLIFSFLLLIPSETSAIDVRNADVQFNHNMPTRDVFFIVGEVDNYSLNSGDLITMQFYSFQETIQINKLLDSEYI